MNFIYDPSLVLYLPLYELDGGSIVSRDACGHLSSVAGALWRLYGRYFDGSDDQINCGATPALDIASISIEAWMNSNVVAAGGAGGVVYSRFADPGTGANGFELRFEGFGNKKMSFFVIRDGAWPSVQDTNNVIAKTLTWYHIVATYDGADARLYINNEFINAGSPSPPKSVSCNAIIGARTSGGAAPHRWDGLIGEVRIYNRALVPPEIEQNYLATKWRYR